ncbi:hypothetical protein F5I97DRAFT_1924637 [Phlebopus sp. FC_14]|nr:hypothetical protein F5I97DRAFT_1924637 [Phlebopus sp. FC_14]
MSLYTPIFPSFSQRLDDEPKGISTPSPKTQNYVEYLRDVHLFLSTQGELLSPPSRPSSPNFNDRVENLRKSIQDAFDATGGEPASGKWTHVSEKLKLGCVKGGYSSNRTEDKRGTKDGVEWILPDEEEVWIEWEREREERRQRKGKGKAPQQFGSIASLIAPAPGPSNHANLTELGRSQDPAPVDDVPAVSPATLLRAQEKVIKWQATIPPEVLSDVGRDQALPSSNGGSVRSASKGKVLGQEKTHSSLGFPVIKRAIGASAGKKSKGGPTVPGPPRQRRGTTHLTLTPQPRSLPEAARRDEVHTDTLQKASLGPGSVPKITDFPETPYLPPSFPSHLDTSTPQPQNEPEVPVRAKPPPIMPLPPSSSTPPPSTPGKSFEGHTHIQREPNGLSSPLPQLDAYQLSQHHRPFSMSPGIPNAFLTTLPAKKPQAISQDYRRDARSPSVSRVPALDYPQATRPGQREGANAPLPIPDGMQMSTSDAVEALTKAFSASHPPGACDNDSIAQENSSPAKSTKSHFSIGSDSPNSPIPNHNLLLDSPVSPMLYFAQNGSQFHPRYTSTQQGRNPLVPASSDFFGLGYNSQFDVEKHVDRVSEFLEKDVDFDGWLRDVPAVDGIEASKDQ